MSLPEQAWSAYAANITMLEGINSQVRSLALYALAQLRAPAFSAMDEIYLP